MSGLPARFPRTSLINAAGMLENRIGALLDETQALIDEAEEAGAGHRTVKLAQRFNALDDARSHVNDARLALWRLP